MARGPVKALTAADIDAKIAEAEKLIASLKAKKYEATLDTVVSELGLPAVFADIRSKTGADDVTILAAFGKAAKIARLEITQKAPVSRAKKAK